MALSSVRCGQYVGVTHKHERTLPDGRRFLTIVYGGYDAYGLIGTEHNGLAVLQEHPKRQVVLDEVMKADSGWFGPTKGQTVMFQTVTAMEDVEFITWCNGQARLREPVAPIGAKKKRRTRK